MTFHYAFCSRCISAQLKKNGHADFTSDVSQRGALSCTLADTVQLSFRRRQRHHLLRSRPVGDKVASVKMQPPQVDRLITRSPLQSESEYPSTLISGLCREFPQRPRRFSARTSRSAGCDQKIRILLQRKTNRLHIGP